MEKTRVADKYVDRTVFNAKKNHQIFNNEDSSRAKIIGTSDALNSPRGSSISDGGEDGQEIHLA